MRLLTYNDEHELTFTRDLTEDIPQYAILSHTWGPDEEEVIFQDIQNGSGRGKEGFSKIRLCGQQADEDGLQHFWVDTCCIDKTNNTELSEAIVSMYRWYQKARVCYVYLADVPFRPESDEHDPDHSQRIYPWKPAFRKSRWFTRRWTLQELLAPDRVVFFSREWVRLGTKDRLEELIHEITDIPINALRGRPLTNFSISERMRWAAHRNAKRNEDRAYCLFGIFGVFLPLMYGEGDHAFIRLTEEIDKRFKTVSKISTGGSDNFEIIVSGQRGTSVQDGDRLGQHEDGSSTKAHQETPQERRRRLLKSLGFEQMDSRRSTIKKAHASTCAWILKHSTYLDWIDPQQLEHHLGFLWINGKPGAGKSTLMKFLHAHHDEAKSESELVISFFFNARGDSLEKSITGMYRGLLNELLHQAVDLQDLLDKHFESSGTRGGDLVWNVESLQVVLSAAVVRLGQRKLTVFIDALDECDEQQIRDMVVFLEELAFRAAETGIQFYTCFSSRHYPTIDIRIGQKLVLEDEAGHVDDLAKYIQSHLRAGKGQYAEEIRKGIQQKANGVFMWVALVVNILNEEIRRGRMFVVKKRLEEIPPRLGDLFKDILTRDSINVDDLLLCLQWILFAKRPLRREEFYFAMATLLDSDSDRLTEWNPEQVTVEDMNSFVLNSSKGLAELTKSEAPTVQFIHESIRDFLLKDNGLMELWPDLAQNLKTRSHDELKRGCLEYLSIDISAYIQRNDDLPKPDSASATELRLSLKDKFPLLEYASQCILYHAEEAATETSQDDILKDFDLRRWLYISNIFAVDETRRHTLDASLSYVLAANNCAKLLRKSCSHKSIFASEKQPYRHPLVAAIANGSRDAVRVLLQQDSQSLAADDVVANFRFHRAEPPRKDQTLLTWAIARYDEALAKALLARIFASNETSICDIEAKTKSGQTALLLAAKAGMEPIVRLLWRYADIRACDNLGHTVLHCAVQGSSSRVLRALLRAPLAEKVEIEARNRDLGMTPLHLAAAKGNAHMVDILLDNDADIDTQNDHQETALLLASEQRHVSVVQLLLQRGADLGVRNSIGMTALLYAAKYGEEKIVNLLLKQGLDIEMKDNEGNTALLHAVIGGYETIAKILLGKGADIEARNNNGRTSLSFAVDKGKSMIDILLAWNADPAAKDTCGKTAFSYLQHVIEHKYRGYLSDYSWMWSEMLSIIGSMLNKICTRDDLAVCRSSALIWAAQNTWKDFAQTLILDGTDVDTKDEHGRTALWHALMYGQYGMIELLVAQGANIMTRNLKDETLLSFAIKDGDASSLAALLNCEAEDIMSGGSLDRTSVAQRVRQANLTGGEAIALEILNS